MILELDNYEIFVIFLLAALVNKGNVIFKKGDFEKAREFFREALQNDSSCIEALYNLGKLYFVVPGMFYLA